MTTSEFTAEVSNPQKSTCCDSVGAWDLDVDIYTQEQASPVVSGEVTVLYRDGEAQSWGTLDHWVSSELSHWLTEQEEAVRYDVIQSILYAATEHIKEA